MSEKYTAKSYMHFDYKFNFKGKVENYVYGFKENPNHNFLPLVYGLLSYDKFSDLSSFDKNDYFYRLNKNGIETKIPIKNKKRPIMYASHKDNYIYKHYGLELNDLYNKYVFDNNFDDSSIAYRTNKKGKCNIDFSAEVINFINKNEGCYIYVGDFSSFFDTLNHKYLKKMISKLYENGNIPEHQYKIYRSLTKYSYIDIRDINYYTSKKRNLYDGGKLRFLENMRDFRNFKKEETIVKEIRKVKIIKFKKRRYCNQNKKVKKRNNKYKSVVNSRNHRYKKKIIVKEEVLKKNLMNYGIPQGTAMSAIYSNIYMLEVDEYINTLITKYSGIYRRYSDDFVIILPNVSKEEFTMMIHNIENKLRNEAKLTIHPSKTQVMEFKKNKLMDLYVKLPKSLDYLGFTFDGINVKMREKSIYNYYRTAYELVKKGVVISKKKGHIFSKKRLTYKRRLYQKYHIFGERTDVKYGYKKRAYGTFITYALKSQKLFDELSPNTNNLMFRQIETHQEKIKKRVFEAELYLKTGESKYLTKKRKKYLKNTRNKETIIRN